MSFSDGLSSLRTELERTEKYKGAYDNIMGLRADPAFGSQADALDELAEGLGKALGTCVAELVLIVTDLQKTYEAAAEVAQAAASNLLAAPPQPPGT